MQEYDLIFTPATPPRYPFHTSPYQTTLPHSLHPPQVPCNTCTSRCIRHRTRSKRGIVSVYQTNYNLFLSIYSILNAFQKYEKITHSISSLFKCPPGSQQGCEIAAVPVFSSVINQLFTGKEWTGFLHYLLPSPI